MPADPVSRKSLFWTRVGAIAGLAALPAAFLIFFLQDQEKQPAQESARPTVAESSVLPPTASGERSGTGSPCLSREGVPVECVTPGAGLRVSGTDCATTAVLRRINVDPAVLQLAVEGLTTTSGCGLFLVQPALQAGASAVDLQSLSEGDLEPRLQICLTSQDASGETACSEPHLGEWVEAWKLDPRPDRAACDDVARRYSQRDFSDPAETLETSQFRAAVGSAEQSTRCAIVSPRVLHDSVYRLAGNPLPTTRPQ